MCRGITKPVLWALALTLFGIGGASAQDAMARKTEVMAFEVLSVDGNDIVVRSANGARELTVPDDFRFTVDGKPVSVHELQAGMKGTATITTTTMIHPVVVTTIKKGTVVRRVRDSVYVKTEDGTTRKFTKGELQQRGIEVIMDGKPVRLADLKGGDQLTATIITAGPPVILTDQQVTAELSAPEAAPAETPAPAAAAASAPAETAPTPAVEASAPAAEPAAAEPAAAAPVATVTDEPAKPEEKPADRKFIWIGLAVVIAIGLFMLMRRRGASPA